ncbi:PASTA domain-containing protein [Streptomyces roseolus]|uniref:PASTA domain-containing protein n=1 Tax=Streptomyces roseolus TaxID=67358 RepID=UPI0033C1ABB4
MVRKTADHAKIRRRPRSRGAHAVAIPSPQSPRPGRHRSATEVDFGTVKPEETRPAEDAGGDVAEAGSTMPDFTGESVKVAREALDSSTSLTVRDASGEDRMVLVESNWQVCSQEPAAGAALDGRPVTLRAVKFDETC